MELTTRERTALIASCIGITICTILLLSFDAFFAPLPGSSSWYLKFLFVFPIVMGSLTILWIIKPRNLTPDIVESSELDAGALSEALTNVGIVPSGQILKVIKKVAYSDPQYARKRIRAWPWRAKGRVVLTSRELIFLSVKKKKIYFSVPIAQIESIQPFTARGGARTFKVCEIIYQDSSDREKISVLFMGTIGFGTFDYPSEIELKSMKLLETFQKWYDTWVVDLP